MKCGGFRPIGLWKSRVGHEGPECHENLGTAVQLRRFLSLGVWGFRGLGF